MQPKNNSSKSKKKDKKLNQLNRKNVSTIQLLMKLLKNYNSKVNFNAMKIINLDEKLVLQLLGIIKILKN